MSSERDVNPLEPVAACIAGYLVLNGTMEVPMRIGYSMIIISVLFISLDALKQLQIHMLSHTLPIYMGKVCDFLFQNTRYGLKEGSVVGSRVENGTKSTESGDYLLQSGGKWFIVVVTNYGFLYRFEEWFQMFMGKYNNCIDAKSRMIVPAKFREQLGDKCVVTRGADMCLVIFSSQGWEDFIEDLQSLGMTPSERRSVLRHFSANAVEDEIDKQGRILLPAELMDFANISKELITVGSVDKIEVWSREEWENKENRTNLSHIEVSNIIDKYDKNGRCSF